MSWLSLSRLKSHYSQTYTSPKAASISKYKNEQHCCQKFLEQTALRLMEKLEADLRVAFPHTGGHFSYLVALLMRNALKFSAFQRPVRVHATTELGLTELKETKKDTRQHLKGPSQDSSTCSRTLLAWMTPRTGENSDRHLLPLLQHAHVP